MTTKEYAKEILSYLKYTEFCGGLNWRFESNSSDYVEATTNVSTVAGRKNMSIVVSGGIVFPVIVLAQGVSDISDEELTDVLIRMNNVNYNGGNNIVAFAKQGSNGLDFYLRGLQVQTHQDEFDKMSEDEQIAVLAMATSSIDVFTSSLNNDFLAEDLQNVFNLF